MLNKSLDPDFGSVLNDQGISNDNLPVNDTHSQLGSYSNACMNQGDFSVEQSFIQALPVPWFRLQRSKTTMILLSQLPSESQLALLRDASIQVGVAFAGHNIRHAANPSTIDYGYIGLDRSVERVCAKAIKDLKSNGWVVFRVN